MATSKKADDAGQAEVQAVFDEAAEKGYFGEVPDGPPNEAYALTSGPDSPSAAEVTPSRFKPKEK
jgi:hypothetical protein